MQRKKDQSPESQKTEGQTKDIHRMETKADILLALAQNCVKAQRHTKCSIEEGKETSMGAHSTTHGRTSFICSWLASLAL